MLFSLCKKTISLQEALAGAKKWIADNTIDGGIAHSSKIRKPYPEVTGYYIPTLLKWGEVDRAKHYGDWLLSIQTQEGAWQNTDLDTVYTFDTGQILKGLYELIPYDKKYEVAFLKGCDWFITQIDKSGCIHTPTQDAFSGIGSEYIHLYTLEPLKLAAKKYNREDYMNAVKKAENYYLNLPDLTDFKIITHFHAYIIEALIDLGHKGKAQEALNTLKKHQFSNGAIPAFPNVKWICLTAILQYAVCYYKLEMFDEGDKLLFYAISKQNKSGGFFGGYGWFVTYFKNIEISWPVKYLLDALYLRKELQKGNGSSIQKGLKDCDEKYAHSYLSSHQNNPTRKYQLDYLAELMMDRLSISDSHSILYVGCGTAGFTRLFKKTAKFVGIDYSEKMLHLAPLSNSREYFCGTFEEYQTQDKFDIISLTVYGPYVALTSHVLDKAKSMLKKDGLIFCPLVKYKMSKIGKIKHILKHALINKNLNYCNVKNARKMFLESQLHIQAIISIDSSYCDTYILKNA